ncbi:Glucosamine-6-phosphate deaminase [Dyadobacter sp. CECT 9275]|uniref:Glucosamine-6-phosphate deaminase n=1 Tax=Dyadobacter helix TaxID=2822344 RepID=A0A916J9Y7_9BACT|nr:glucosamine-6-phosphate deaminase [Dyadobacter sp. CECT 9275]CAG4989807.1 Glucosamine-6-phosphate deaminase [Dyadobacter sp. CECT 9275]
MSTQAQEIKIDRLNVKIFENRRLMGIEAAQTVAAKIRELQKTQETIHIIFASAPSQNEFLEVLMQEKDIAWEKINAFHMDEYVNLPGDAPQSFGHFLKVRLFDHVPVGQVFYLNGNATDIEAECKRYADLLIKYPTDIVCLGIGENCHLAFNDPHVAFFNDPLIVKQVELDTPCRQQQVNDECFDTFEDVPTHALTITIPALLKAKYAYAMVPGTKKAEAIQHTLEDDIQEAYPSTVLRNHPNVTLFIDKDSAGKLREISSYSQA